MLIDGRANGNDDSRGIIENGRIRRGLEETGLNGFGEQALGIILIEGHAPAVYQGDALGLGIYQLHRIPFACEGQPQRQTDMAAAADNHQGPCLEPRSLRTLAALQRLHHRLHRSLHGSLREQASEVRPWEY